MRNPSVSRYRAVVAKVTIGVTLLGSIGAAYAFKSIFARPGEEAMSMIPSNALLAGSLDLSPSPQQALAFKHIDDAMARNGMSGIEASILDMFGQAPGLDALKPYVLRSGAMAMVPTGQDKETSGLMLIALSDPAAAQQVLDKFGKPAFFRGTKYTVLKGSHEACMRVMGNFLVIGEKPIAVHDARLVAEHQMASITTLPEFQEARGRVASDANVMAFINPAMLGEVGVSALKSSKASWMSMGLAIRDGGIAMSVWNQWDPTTVKGLQRFAQTKEIRRDLFQSLPSGAYGMFVVSQPASYYRQFNDVAAQEPGAQEPNQELSKHVREDMGMDLDKDLLAACEGDAVIAAYPSKTGDPAGVDMLLVIDDTNGAKPAAALAKFQEHVDEQLAKEPGSPPLWVSNDVAGTRQFKLGDKAEKDMQDGLGNSIDPGTFKKDLLMQGKTLVWASVGNAVIASTNKDLLQRGIESYRNRVGTLAADTEFIKSDTEVLDGSQVLALFNVGRIAKGVANTVNTDKMDPENAKSFKSITDAFSKLVDPFYLKMRVQPNGEVACGTFIPMDYDRLFDMLGKDNKKK